MRPLVQGLRPWLGRGRHQETYFLDSTHGVDPGLVELLLRWTVAHVY